MANKTLFASSVGKMIPQTDAMNGAQAPAYRLAPKHALAQYATTGCMNKTFYASATEQLDTVLTLATKAPTMFLAQLAVYAREKGYMKDLPALLCAVLSVRDPKLLEQIFDRVMINGKMLRNFVQIMRSGVVGRKSLGALPKRLVQQWLAKRPAENLFRDSVGNSPSLADVIKMVHPKPADALHDALYAYFIGKEYDSSALPDLVRKFEAYKVKKSSKVPAVPFQMLTALELGKEEWIEIARNASWQMTRMNLNTFARHGVFEDSEITRIVASRLSDAEEIRKASVFPYQLMVAYQMAGENVPHIVREALQDAVEIALDNTPVMQGQVVVCPDVSGSMGSPVTGYREGATSHVRCIDVAALVAASILRKNRSAIVLPFEREVVDIKLNVRDSVMTNANKLAAIGGGGTNCSAPLAMINREQAKVDLVVMISDNESWADPVRKRGTAMMQEWEWIKVRNPRAKLVCIDIQPNASTQAQEREDVLNVGGFSDRVFEIMEHFSKGTLNSGHFVGLIEAVTI